MFYFMYVKQKQLTMSTLSMRLGPNIGKLIVEMAQENIVKGEPEKAITLFTQGLQGFPRSYAIAVLKAEYALCVDTENQELYLDDNAEALEKNKQDIYFYDWNCVVRNSYERINDTKEYIKNLRSDFLQLTKKNIYDFNILEYGQKVNAVDMSHLCARVLADNPFERCTGSGEQIWNNTVDEYFDGILDNHLMPFVIIAEYVKSIRELSEKIVKFCLMYEFLAENQMCDRIDYYEEKIESMLYILNEFTDTSVGYYHPMCNVEIYTLKNDVVDNILKTKLGSEYLKHGVIGRNIEDKYDAGWLTPEGIFYANNGPTGNFIHMNLARDIYEHTANPLHYEMKEDGVTLFGLESPERWLEKKGWIKIHDDSVYGCFSAILEDHASEPTEKQIDFICKYIKKHYGGKFYTEPALLRRKDAVQVSKLRQMDKFAIRELFEL